MVSNVDLDLTGQSPTMPQFKDVWVTCTTGNVVIEEDDGGKDATRKGQKRLVIPLIFEEEATAVDGRKVPVGFSGCTDEIGLFEVGKRTKDMIQRDVLRFQCAALGISQGKPFDPAEVSGKRIKVGFSLRADRQDATKFYQDYKYAKV
jgi:hypothetical protein